MSEFKTDKISPRSGTTQTIGDSGDSVSTSSGSTINNAGTITTAGITGGTINNTTGSIYLRGEVDWKPGDIKTASFTATDNQGFFVNTTSGEITVTLPASPSAGDVVGIKDYANTFDTNKCILNANGNKIQGSTTNFEIIVEGSSIIIIYVDATQGWVITDASKASDISQDIKFVTASGGTETTSGNFKIHTFTGPGTFTVTCAGNAAGSNTVSYLVLAGGGSGGYNIGGGGGAGGFREGKSSSDCYTASPLNAPAGLPVPAQAYPITVGGGASGSGTSPGPGNKGSDSVFSTITSTGGGGGGSRYLPGPGLPGGSGGGGGTTDGCAPSFPTLAPCGSNKGSGNTPPVSPPQGQNGGGAVLSNPASGGGGAGAAGATGGGSTSGPGGNGVTTSINASPVTRAGGGGGGAHTGIGQTVGTGGSGGGTDGVGPGTSSSSPANSGGGSGGGGNSGGQSGSGGSGIVIIRYKFQ